MKISVLSGAAVGLPVSHALGDSVSGNRIAESRLPKPFTKLFTRPEVAVPVRTDPLTGTQIYRIEMRPFRAEIVPGLVTDLWGYNGVYPGPTIVVDRNTPTRVRQINNLPRVHPTLGFTPWTSVHLHGHASLPQYDGYASDISNPGQYKDYEYQNVQEARTQWYHDHGVHHTAETVQMGLAAFYLVHDELEQGLPIPHGDFDVPLMFADISFNADGSVLFDNNDNKGLYGDVIMVNGQPWPVMPVKRRKYRFRFLNACPARSFKWSLDSGDTMTIIGTDAGLVPRPIPVKSFRHGVAERYEVVIDFAKYKKGDRITLRNAAPTNTISFTNTAQGPAVPGDRRAIRRGRQRDPRPAQPRRAHDAVEGVRREGHAAVGLRP
jgi:FtsP/CotA-like multicopper oxidase with cupredoxin domain